MDLRGRVLDVSQAETPRSIGLAVVGLVTDPTRLDRSGRIDSTADLAKRYHFTDTDGSLPPTSTEVG